MKCLAQVSPCTNLIISLIELKKFKNYVTFSNYELQILFSANVTATISQLMFDATQKDTSLCLTLSLF